MKYIQILSAKFIIMAILAISLTPSLSFASKKLEVEEMPAPCPVVTPVFTYKNGLSSSNQITWSSLEFMDKQFLETTKPGKQGQPGFMQWDKEARATSTVELLALVRLALHGTPIPSSDDKKAMLAVGEMAKMIQRVTPNKTLQGILLLRYTTSESLPMDVLADIQTVLKADIEKFRPLEGLCALHH